MSYSRADGSTNTEHSMRPALHVLDHDYRDALVACHPASVGWALSCCAFDPDEADDVLQASYLKVLDGRAIYEGRASFKSWLFAVIRRTASQRRRQRILRNLITQRSLYDLISRPSELPNTDQEAVQSDTTARLEIMLRELPRRQREVLHLVFYQDLTIEESARVLDISLGTARTHYERGKASMRRLLEADPL